MTDHQEYLARREEDYIKKRMANDKKRGKKLYRLYQNAIKECQKEILAFYARYFNDQTPTLEEAKRLISQSEAKDIAGIRRRISRLQLLELQLSQIMSKTTKDAEEYMRDEFIREAIDVAEDKQGVAPLNENSINEIINHSFKAGDFSDNIWGDKGALEKAINQGLIRSLVMGEHPNKVASRVAKEIGATQNKMKRVMRTEIGLVQIAQQRKNYEDTGIKYYQNIREPGACDKCKDFGNSHETIDDAEVFKVSEMERGINAPLFHPNCRCSTIPVVRYKDESELFVRDENDRNNVDMNLTDEVAEQITPEKLNQLAHDIVNRKHSGKLSRHDNQYMDKMREEATKQGFDKLPNEVDALPKNKNALMYRSTSSKYFLADKIQYSGNKHASCGSGLYFAKSSKIASRYHEQGNSFYAAALDKDVKCVEPNILYMKVLQEIKKGVSDDVLKLWKQGFKLYDIIALENGIDVLYDIVNKHVVVLNRGKINYHEKRE